MLTIDRALYADAADLLGRANQTLATSASVLFDALGEAAVSAGEGEGARAWCTSYQKAARSVTTEVSQVVDAFGNAATLIDASGHNHARAEAAAAPYGLPAAPLSRRDLASVYISGIPEMYGGSVGEPWGWGLIAGRLHGFAWPGADIERVQALAAAWHTAADDLRGTAYSAALADSYLGTMTSPELPAAIEVCDRLRDACTALATDCDALGSACTAYAGAVSRARAQVMHAFKELLGVAGIGAFLGIGATLLSGGLTGLASSSLEGTVAGTFITRIIALLDALADALAALNPATAISDARGGQSAWLRTVANAAPVLAAVEADTSLLSTELDGALQAGGAPGAGAQADDEVINAGWANPKKLADHFNRHASDVGASTEAEYVEAAQDLLRRARVDGLPMKVDARGNILVFDPTSELFGVYRPDGLARTIFRPTPDALRYWAEQRGELQ